MLAKLILRRNTFSFKPWFVNICSNNVLSYNMALKEEHKYIFKDVRNDSIIKEFSFGLINPELLKIPDSGQSNIVMNRVIKQLDNLPLEMSTMSILEQLKKIGLFGTLIPCKYGGLGLSLSDHAYVLQHERLVEWSLTLVAHLNLCSQTILQYGNEEQKDKYLPRLASGEMIGAFCLTEKSSGSDILAMKTVAVLNGLEDYYVVDGTKHLIVNGAVANLMVVFALTQDSRYEGGRDYVTALLVEKDTKGISIVTPNGLECWSGSHIADVSFKSVFVPVQNVLTEDHGGYKIANYVQNIGRYIVGSCVSGWLRILINDLIDKERALKFTKDTNLHHLLNECITYHYAIESTVFFTTRFADKFEVPEIELESSTVKVFSMESAKIVVASYLKIMEMLGEHITPSLYLVCDRINYLQSFMGSNYFVRLYIGGTMLQLSEYNFLEIKERLKKPVENFSWLIKTAKDVDRDINWTDKFADSRCSHIIDRALFLNDLKVMYKQLQISRLQLCKTIGRYKESALDHQFILESMSHIGIQLYVVSCCVARANTNYGDFEMVCTRRILDKAKVIIETSIASLTSAAREGDFSFVPILVEDINLASGYPSANVLDLKVTDKNTGS